MEILPNFVDMALTPAEQKADEPSMTVSSYSAPTYPYGLCLCFTDEQLGKLDLEDDANVGDHVLLHCIAKVTSVSKQDTENGPKTRVEMQITHIAAEDDDEEDDASYKPTGKPYTNMYNKG